MSLLDLLEEPAVWADFIRYKSSLACPKQFVRALETFVSEERWRPVCARIRAGEPFPLPRKSIISKLSTQKKRVVYTYPEDENVVLKLLTHLLLRRYDGAFDPNLWSFRPGRTAKDALRMLLRTKDLPSLWSYKVDVSNYFNSIPLPRLIPMLETLLEDDPALLAFLRSLLEEPEVLDGDQRVTEQKGIMAGTPLSAFYANVYLRALDHRFAEAGVPYARYSDDIILFAPTKESCERYAGEVRSFLHDCGLGVNGDKEVFSAPEDGWTFLGFSWKDGVVDIAPATVKKLKGKMRRKSRALTRWAGRNELEPEKAARAFIRVFDRKLLDAPADNELSWSRWFFPVITTDKSLREIDRYAQDCLRFLLSGKRTKARFNIRYEDLKSLGYRSLVHEYYGFEKE